MDMPSAKELMKLAKACRKSGIKSFKGGGIEFTLDDGEQWLKPPTVQHRAIDAPITPVDPSTEYLTEEQMLFYSVTGAFEENAKAEEAKSQ